MVHGSRVTKYGPLAGSLSLDWDLGPYSAHQNCVRFLPEQSNLSLKEQLCNFISPSSSENLWSWGLCSSNKQYCCTHESMQFPTKTTTVTFAHESGHIDINQ